MGEGNEGRKRGDGFMAVIPDWAKFSIAVIAGTISALLWMQSTSSPAWSSLRTRSRRNATSVGWPRCRSTTPRPSGAPRRTLPRSATTCPGSGATST